MKNTFTPGPWVAIDTRNTLDDWIGAFGILASKQPLGTKYNDICTVWPRGGVEKTNANASLIAAAPDLLEALEQALKIVDAYRRVSGGDGDIAAMNARSAIAKAKGADHAR